jgi:hypothetical protein
MARISHWRSATSTRGSPGTSPARASTSWMLRRFSSAARWVLGSPRSMTSRVFEGSDGSTMMRTLVSKWQVEHGVAQAKDAAMATPENRVALKGGLSFINGYFDEVTVALIDAKGCAVRSRHRGDGHSLIIAASRVGPLSADTRSDHL